jgi:hypothetical protein
MSAKTIYIDNSSGQARLTDRCYDELTKWGRFTIVSDPAKADVVLEISTQVHTSGYSGHSTTDDYGNTNTSLNAQKIGSTTIAVLDHLNGRVLWSDTRPWGNLFTGFRSAGRGVIKELRERMEEHSIPNAADLSQIGHELLHVLMRWLWFSDWRIKHWLRRLWARFGSRINFFATEN